MTVSSLYKSGGQERWEGGQRAGKVQGEDEMQGLGEARQGWDSSAESKARVTDGQGPVGRREVPSWVHTYHARDLNNFGDFCFEGMQKFLHIFVS